MFEVNQLSISISDRYVVKSLSFVLQKNDKLAIIGEEGNGKSTLLKVLMGACDYADVTGHIHHNHLKIGYLEQFLNPNIENQTGRDLLYQCNLYDMRYQYLYTLGLDESILDQPLKVLSGGEKVKLEILKLLLDDCDIYFLDEPTNDLDIETLAWLEQFICRTEKPIIYVSHDETLLSHTANMILHLEQIKHKTECRHTLVRMDYDTYVQSRLHKIVKNTQIANNERREWTKKQQKLQQIMNKVEYQQNTISRKDPHGAKVLKKKMHSLKSQEAKLNHFEFTEKPDVEEGISFAFINAKIPKSKVVLSLKLPELSISNKVLSKNVFLEVIGNEHICIIGKNGVGKSTLIKQIYDILRFRTDIKVGYMSQNYDDILGEYDKVLEYLVPNKQKEEITKARLYLGNMKFTREEMTAKIKDLSSGSKAKLILMKMVLMECNVLLLDEPTRNVSPLSNPIIRASLKQFEGTIISVSHDRKYLEEVINRIYLLDKTGLQGMNIDKYSSY